MTNSHNKSVPLKINLKTTQDEIALLRELGGGKSESEATVSAEDEEGHVANVKQQSRHQSDICTVLMSGWSGRGFDSSDPKDVESLNGPATIEPGVQVYCRELQCVAVCCSVLQIYTYMYIYIRSTLQHTATPCFCLKVPRD